MWSNRPVPFSAAKHAACITWEEFERNLKAIANNALDPVAPDFHIGRGNGEPGKTASRSYAVVA
jgi:hypothetical protein